MLVTILGDGLYNEEVKQHGPYMHGIHNFIGETKLTCKLLMETACPKAPRRKFRIRVVVFKFQSDQACHQLNFFCSHNSNYIYLVIFTLCVLAYYHFMCIIKYTQKVESFKV